MEISKEEPKQEPHICKYCDCETIQSDDECYAKQEEVTINQFPSESVELFNQNNKSLGLINELQLLDVQCQIAEKRLEGYYVKMGNLKCEIDNCGELEDWDGVTFHREYVLLTKLKRIQQKHGKNKIY